MSRLMVSPRVWRVSKDRPEFETGFLIFEDAVLRQPMRLQAPEDDILEAWVISTDHTKNRGTRFTLNISLLGLAFKLNAEVLRRYNNRGMQVSANLRMLNHGSRRSIVRFLKRYFELPIKRRPVYESFDDTGITIPA